MGTATPAVEETWNLADLFADDDAFEQARLALATTLPTLAQWKGRLLGSAALLAEGLDGIDTAHKIAILASLAFGIWPTPIRARAPEAPASARSEAV